MRDMHYACVGYGCVHVHVCHDSCIWDVNIFMEDMCYARMWRVSMSVSAVSREYGM